MTKRRWFLFLACAGAGLAALPFSWSWWTSRPSRPPAGPSTSARRIQISLFWGGGAPRDWNGTFRVVPPDPHRGRFPWVWMTDFEDGDRCLAGAGFPAAKQGAPAGWKPTVPAQRPGAPKGPPAGAVLATHTSGRADGLCFLLDGDPTLRIVLDLGPGAVLDTTPARLLERALVLPVGQDGNVLVARAVDLDREVSLSVPHAGETARRASLHTHSCFSTNDMALGPVARSLRPFARTVWWTDHNLANQRLILAGDFEDPALTQRFWEENAHDAEILSALLDDSAHSGEHSYCLTARGTADVGGTAWIELGKGAGQLNTGLCANPGLRWAWQPLPGSGNAPSVAWVRAELSSGRAIRYLSAPTSVASPSEIAATDLTLEAGPGDGGWSVIERDVASDARALFGPVDDDALRRVQLGLVVPAGDTASTRFDDVELLVPEPAEVIAKETEELESFRFLRSYVGLEDSAWISPRGGYGVFYPHLTALLPPGAAARMPGRDHAPSPAERAEFVRRVQAAGGCVGTHHMQVDDHYEALCDAGAFGIDLFEIGAGWWQLPAYASAAERRARDAHGYPPLSEDEVYPLLVRWDRLTARGVLLTGYGAPDLHFRFSGPAYGWMNRWLTWILCADDAPQALLDALRSGRACASEWHSQAVVSLSVEGAPWMGKLVATDRPSQRVIAHVSGALPGSRLRWIQGPLARAQPGPAADEPEPARAVRIEGVSGRTHESSLEIDTRQGVFVRAELLNPAGHLVALSNPVVFAPYWPERWPPGRVAFDWNGVTLVAEHGLLLESARLEGDGTLTLRGRSRSAGASLELSGAGLKVAGGSGGWRARASSGGPTGRGLVLEDIPAGPFQVVLATGRPAPPRADARALPRRKELFLSIDVGNPEAEEPYALEGFGPPYQGPLVLAGIEDSYRPVGPAPARFRLPLPPGERVWLRLRSFGFSRATGRLSVDGRPAGTFERMSSKVFAIDPSPDGAPEREFTIELDPPAAGDDPDPIQLRRIEVWRGEGVVDY